MMAMSAMESVLLILSLISGNDLLSMIDGNDYFKSRKIPVTVEKMVELATTQASTSKDQVAQLLALRMLAEDADEVKKAKNFNEILKSIEDVAQGKKAQDLQGFAAEYARRTAIALGSKLEPAKSGIPENSIRQDSINWFPKDVTLLVSQDFRFEGGDPTGKEAKELRQKMMKMFPPGIKEKLYSIVEELGNIQMERFSLGYLENPQNAPDGKIYMRISGKLNHKLAVAYIKKMGLPNYQFKETKNFRGKPITMMWKPNNPPALALIGDTDLIIAGPEGNFGNQDSLKLVEEMLEIQRGKQPSALAGPLANKLKKISPKAAGMVVGQVSEGIRKELTRGGGPFSFRAFPKDVVIEAKFQGKDLKLQLETEMPNADDAKNFAEDTKNLVQLGLAGLQNPPPFPANFPNPAKLIKGATDLLKSIKVEPNGKSLVGSMTVSRDLMDAYMDFGLSMFGVMDGFGGGALPPPPPAPKIDEKKEAREIEKKIKDARLNLDNLPQYGNGLPMLEPLTLERNVVACWHGDTRKPPTTISA